MFWYSFYLFVMIEKISGSRQPSSDVIRVGQPTSNPPTRFYPIDVLRLLFDVAPSSSIIKRASS